MKVEDVMTPGPAFVRPFDSLARAAALMWDNDCGIVPVVDGDGRVRGVVTDRDICIATWSRNRAPSEIAVAEMHFPLLKVCAADDDVKDVLRRMRKYRIRRLCVTDDAGKLVGIVSLTDILVKAGDKKSVRKLLLSTLNALGRPLPIVLKAVEEKEEAEDDETSGNPEPEVEMAEETEDDDVEGVDDDEEFDDED